MLGNVIALPQQSTPRNKKVKLEKPYRDLGLVKMIDEEKQIDDTAPGEGNSQEVKPAMETEQTPQNYEGAGQTTADKEPTTAVNSVPAEIDYQAAISELAAQVESLRAENNQYKRIAADFENFRKRTAKEKEELQQQIKSATITELLPVVDNFERARTQLKPQTEAEMSIFKSYQSVYKQMVDALKRLGVSPMRAEGMQFDPNLHEAVIRQPTNEHPEGTVLEELVRGYYLGERVLRHAMVKVATPADSTSEGTSTDSADS